MMEIYAPMMPAYWANVSLFLLYAMTMIYVRMIFAKMEIVFLKL